MSKKLKILFSFCITLLITSCTVFALGNDYTFSKEWYDAVLSKTQTLYNVTQDAGASTEQYTITGGVTSNYFVSTSAGVVGGLTYPYDTSYVFLKAKTRYTLRNDAGYTYLSLTSPVNVTVKPGETVYFQSMLFVENAGKYPSNEFKVPAFVHFNLADGTVLSLGSENVLVSYEKTDLGSVILNSDGTAVTGFDTDESGWGTFVYVNWTNNSSDDVIISSYRSIFAPISSVSLRYIPNYYYGFFATKSLNVALPDYVYDNLNGILNELKNQSTQLNDALYQLALLNLKIQELIDEQGNSSSVTNNYYETVTVPSSSDEERQAYIEELITKAEEKVEELNASIDKVDSTFNEITTSTITNVDTSIKQSIDEYLTDSSFTALMEGIFSLDLVMTLLLGAFALATVGYILFGKR